MKKEGDKGDKLGVNGASPLRPSHDGNKWETAGKESEEDDNPFRKKKQRKAKDDSRDENLLGGNDDDEEEEDLTVPPIMRYIRKLNAYNGNTKMLMKNLPPESNINLVVVPMNKHGDGFLVSSYDGRFLKGKMSKAEF